MMRIVTIETTRAPCEDEDGNLIDYELIDEDINEVEIDDFADLLHYMELVCYRSSNGEPDATTWVHDEPCSDFKDGFEKGYVKEYSIHYHSANKSRHLKHWIKAIKLTTE